MPATPPVGNGLKMDDWSVACSVLMAVWPPDVIRSDEVATGRSVVFQLRLVLQIASNLDSDSSMLAPTRAGSRARTRTESVRLTPVPVNCSCWSAKVCEGATPNSWLPIVPCSRAMETASAREM